MHQSNDPVAVHTKPPFQRIVGFDVARALAVFGMVFVNFKMVVGANLSGAGKHFFYYFLEGKAAALFVILAGVGISLWMKAPKFQNAIEIKQKRRSLIKRALLLIILGLPYSYLWPADILHFYGFFMLVSATVVSRSDRVVGGLAGMIIFGFVLLFLLFDYETDWNWDTFEYAGFWTVAGMGKHIFFNGFHPVFPWASFMLLGIILGRLDFGDKKVLKRLGIGGLIVYVFVNATSLFLIALTKSHFPDIDPDMVQFLIGTAPMAPLPLYIFSAMGFACFVISMSIQLSMRFSSMCWIGWLEATGRMALTLYIAHVVIGMGCLEKLGFLESGRTDVAIGSAICFNLGAIAISTVWLSKMKLGPTEFIFRRLSN